MSPPSRRPRPCDGRSEGSRDERGRRRDARVRRVVRAEADRRMVRARPGEPHRRAHRLQRRVRLPVRHRPSHRGGARRPRRPGGARGIELRARSRGDPPRRAHARRGRRLGRLPARGGLGPRRARRRPPARPRRRPVHRGLGADRRRPVVVGGHRVRGRPRARRALGPRIRSGHAREGGSARREPRGCSAKPTPGCSSTAAASTPT
jgi:hypothetical protein